jgi:hypothetical protein
MKECEYRWCLLINSIFSELFSDVRDFVNIVVEEIDRTVEDVCAYRNIAQAVKVEPEYEVGHASPSFETQMYRLAWNKWSDIPPQTVVYEYQTPRTLEWKDADVKPSPYTPDELPIRTVTEVDKITVIYKYDVVRGLRWSDP